MNPSLRFLVNPECYHKLCSACVDRIFSHGPAPCPIAGCPKTLRKGRFREQTFEDVQVEREVDIRRRVAAVFNRREDEFETLRDWNDYLNEVEDITFNLINRIDVAATEERFKAYEAAHRAAIEANRRAAAQEREEFSAHRKLERQQARERRDAARREEAEDRREAEELRRDVLRKLAAGADAAAVAAEQRVQLKKRMDRDAAAAEQPPPPPSTGSNIVIKGLKAPKSTLARPEAPIDPFGGLRVVDAYFRLQDEYAWEGIREAKKDLRQLAGGYDVQEFAHRALVSAFAGLGVLVAEEKAGAGA